MSYSRSRILGYIVLGLCLTGGLHPAIAGEPQQKQDEGQKAKIELKDTEITGSLRDIIGTFKLQETEIVGTTDQPRFNYLLPWQDPALFPDEEADLARGLIEKSYIPLDREIYNREIQFMSK